MNKRKLLRFCKLWGGLYTDPTVVLSTFTDNIEKRAEIKAKAKARKRKGLDGGRTGYDPLAKIRLGGIKKNLRVLENINRRDGGIFFVVNQTDGKGGSNKNIVGINAVWCEFDSHGGSKLPKFPVEPSIVVESSPGNFHVYFLVDKRRSVANNKVMLEQFGSVINRMIKSYGSDENAKDLRRVLRLPGFEHRKKGAGGAFEVSVVAGGGKRYTWEEIKEAFPPIHDIRGIGTDFSVDDLDVTGIEEGPSYADEGVGSKDSLTLDEGGSEPVLEGQLIPKAVDKVNVGFAGSDNGCLGDFGELGDTPIAKVIPERLRITNMGIYGYLLEPATVMTILNGDEFIDPDAGYGVWLNVGIILFNLTQSGAEGYRVWLDWSRVSDDFDEVELAHKWASFRKSGVGHVGAKLGMGTLLRMAQENGYRNGLLKLDVMYMPEYIAEEYRRKQYYVEKAVVKTVHKSELRYIRKIYRSDMNYLQYHELTPKAMQEVIYNVIDDAPYINADGEVKFAKVAGLISKRAGMCTHMYMKPVPGKLMNVRDIEIKVDEHGGINTYMGLVHRKPREGATCDYLNFIFEEILCGGVLEHIEYMKNWFAYTLQRPDKKAIVMPIFQGREGVGKGMILDIIAEAFGSYSVTVTSEETLDSQFNSMLTDSCFIYLNELSLRRESVMNQVKAMLSDEATRKEAKNVEATMTKSYFNVVLSTNNEQVAPTTSDSRRMFFLDVDDRVADDRGVKGGVHDMIFNVGGHQEKNGEGRYAFIQQFLDRDITGFDPKMFPATESHTRVDNLVKTYRKAIEYVYTICKGGMQVVDELDFVPMNKVKDGALLISSPDDYRAYEQFAHMNGVKVALSKRKFAELKTKIGVDIQRKLYYNTEKGGRTYDRASLYESKEKVLSGLAGVLGLRSEEDLTDYMENGLVVRSGRSRSFREDKKEFLERLGVLKRQKEGQEEGQEGCQEGLRRAKKGVKKWILWF